MTWQGCGKASVSHRTMTLWGHGQHRECGGSLHAGPTVLPPEGAHAERRVSFSH